MDNLPKKRKFMATTSRLMGVLLPKVKFGFNICVSNLIFSFILVVSVMRQASSQTVEITRLNNDGE